jgi:hypothetical protein
MHESMTIGPVNKRVLALINSEIITINMMIIIVVWWPKETSFFFHDNNTTI